MDDFKWWVVVMAEAAGYCALDAYEALTRPIRRGWALGLARRVR